MKCIEAPELCQKLNNFYVIDVRESYECELGMLAHTNIPMEMLDKHIHEIPKDKAVVIHCQSGRRSAAVVEYLERVHNINNVYNLNGGYEAWLAAHSGTNNSINE